MELRRDNFFLTSVWPVENVNSCMCFVPNTASGNSKYVIRQRNGKKDEQKRMNMESTAETKL